MDESSAMKNHKNLDLFLHRSSALYYAILDNRGMFSYVNFLYDKTFGPFLPDPAIYTFSSVIVPEDAGIFLKAQQECLNEPGHIACANLRKRRSDGSLLLTRWECCALTDDDKVIGLQCIGKDVADDGATAGKNQAIRNAQEDPAQSDIARQRQITEAAILAQEKQRAEIGRELHDNINQILTTTKLYIDMAINEEELRDELMTKSYQNISTVIEEIRTLSKSLVPPSLGDIGLKEAIYEMIGNLNISRKITIRLRTSGFANAGDSLPGHIKLVIFRIVQEQVNNIVKHSKATNAEIKLAISKENLNITVTDNGLGFDARKKVKGIGLTNITSRAEAYNGRVEIISSPGNGCSLRVSIPI